MLDSESNKPEPNESSAPSPEPSPSQPLKQPFGLREVEATYEMLVKSRQAILRNEHWQGEEVQPIAMLIAMLSQMEGQYRSQLERGRAEEKEALKRAKEEIRKAGGQVNGDAAVAQAPVAG